MENEKIVEGLSKQYEMRFSGSEADRIRVWKVLVDEFFQEIVGSDKVVLDLGCGYGEFINQISAAKRFGMDLNPDCPKHLDPSVTFLMQDCSIHWDLPDESLDVVFTSNFFEHLPNKAALAKTLEQAHRCLKPSGKLICLGPNIKCLPGRYWDFWDHLVELTELSLAEGLGLHGFRVEKMIKRFLPYTMSNRKPPGNWFISTYLKWPILWHLAGHQFLVVGSKI